MIINKSSIIDLMIPSNKLSKLPKLKKDYSSKIISISKEYSSTDHSPTYGNKMLYQDEGEYFDRSLNTDRKAK